METWRSFVELTGGNASVSLWLALFLAVGFVVAIKRGFFTARKIQPKGFRWKTFRNEGFFAALNLVVSAFVLGGLTTYLTANGYIATRSGPVSWWVVALEYALYFFAFDTWFYWLHRGMHIEPMYKYIHKIHHYSTSPNLLTTLSVSPIESLINGGFVPLFLAVMTVHDQTMALITPTNIIMGLYVHSGYEFLPRWWNTNPLTRWFITTTFHDHHHRYFRFNFGGYTTIWDRLCGTVRPKFDEDFERITTRKGKAVAVPVAEPVA